VCLSVAESGGRRIDRTLQIPGGRASVRERTTTVAMHLLKRLLDGATD
jgi:nicotinamide-nucleotide amidase